VKRGEGGHRVVSPGVVVITGGWLLSDQAAYVTGAFLDVSGGR
jgi:hypothetical protein